MLWCRDLERYACGELPNAQAIALEKHLLVCERCILTINGLSQQDTVIEMLRARNPENESVEQLVAKVNVRLRRQMTQPPQNDDTLTAHPASLPPIPIDEDWGEATEDVFNFLAPAVESGEMGRLGGYRVLRILGAGGMGVVFEGEDPKLERKVALKVMKREMAAVPAAKERFFREARITAQLDHDNVVTIFQVDEDRGVPFLAMQMLQGESLDDRIERGEKMDISESLRICRETALGLAAAHAKGLVHRDIKPSNLWLDSTSENRVKILDFGLARASEKSDAKITHSGTIIGTPAYMPPEQTRGEIADGRSDLFSLGCVLYRLVTDAPPFRGRDTISTLIAVASQNPTPPEELTPDIPNALADLIKELLSKETKDRPQTALEVADRLRMIETDLEVNRTVIAQDRPKRAHGEPTQVRRKGRRASAPKQLVAGDSRKVPDKRSPEQNLQSTRSPATAPIPRPRRVRNVIALGALTLFLGVGILFGGTIFRFATDQGVLVIEVQDPSIQVVVKQNGMVVQNKTNNREFTLNAKEGQIEVFEKEGGVGPLMTKQFVLHRGGKTIVKVTLKELANANKPDKPPMQVTPPKGGGTKKVMDLHTHSRKVAEWAKSWGARMRFRGDERDRYEVPSTPFVLTEIHHGVEPNRPPKLEGIEILNGLSSLEAFEVGVGMTDEALKKLDDLPAIKNLTLSVYGSPGITDVSIPMLTRYSTLEELWLVRTSVTAAGIEKLANLPNLKLKSLYLGAILNKDNSEQILSSVGKMKHLETLDLGLCHVQKAGLLHVKDLPLKSLSLYQTNANDEALSVVVGIKSLEHLRLQSTQVTAKGLQALKQLPNLKGLDLRKLALTREEVRQLQAMLPGCSIEASFKIPVSSDRQGALWALGVGGTVSIQMGDEGLTVKKVKDLPSERFTLVGVDLQGRGRLKDLKLSGMKKLRSLDLFNTDVQIEALPLVRELQELAWLRLPHRSANQWVEGLSDKKTLRELSLYRTDITDPGAKHLGKMTWLTRLTLAMTNFGDAGLEQIKGLTNLNMLNLHATRITDKGLVHLKEMKKVEVMLLRDCNITDAGLQHLHTMSGLTVLFAKGTKITAEGIAKLQKALPACKVHWDGGLVNAPKPN